MKTIPTQIKILFFMAFTLMLFSGCDKNYLNRPPGDRPDATAFFNTPTDLEVYTNGFYDMLPDASLYDATYGESTADNIVSLIEPARVTGTRLVPVGRGSGGWSWRDLRTINEFLQNYHKCPDEQARKQYGGIARFFRAWFYYDKVRKFGDVPWYSKVLGAGDSLLYKARDPRTLVMDSVLADIDFAIANIPAAVQLNRITQYTALMLKARICLFEGTFRKYHAELGLQGTAGKWLQDAADAASQLMASGAYSLYTAGGPDACYRTLFARNDQTTTETILARDYNPDFGHHNLGYLMTSPTQGAWGATKDLVNSYLMKDGSRFTDIPGYDTLGFYAEMQNRDPRLTQSIAGPHFTVFGETTPEPVDLNITTTGYRVIKALPARDQWGSSSSYNDIILFRYAEALILEIRRERRIELFDEGLRWDDLMRWKDGKKLEQPMLGIYFSHLGSFDFNGDGIPDVYLYQGSSSGAPPGVTSKINVDERVLTHGTYGNLYPYRDKIIFEEPKDYYYPLPLEDLTLNKQLTQNPGW